MNTPMRTSEKVRLRSRRTPTMQARLSILLGATILVLITSGCAIRHENNRTVFGLDSAAVLGSERAQFTLVDGSSGTLRSLGDDYSLKLDKFFKVVPLGKANHMELAKAQTVGDRTLLVINRVEKNGCVKTTVLAIRGSEVLNWLITPTDCQSRPDITVADGRMMLSYSGNRFLYDNGRMLEEKTLAREQPRPATPGESPGKPPAATENASKPAPRSRTRSTAANSAPAASTPLSTPAPSAPATGTPRRTASNAPAPSRFTPPTPELSFPSAAQEQKPVVIRLE